MYKSFVNFVIFSLYTTKNSFKIPNFESLTNFVTFMKYSTPKSLKRPYFPSLTNFVNFMKYNTRKSSKTPLYKVSRTSCILCSIAQENLHKFKVCKFYELRVFSNV